MKKSIITASILLSLALGAISYGAMEISAQTRPATTDRKTMEEIRRERQQAAEQTKARLQALERPSEGAALERPEKNQAAREIMFSQREEVRIKISERQEELRTRLQAVRDENKQRIILRIYEQLNQLNQRITSHFQNVLDQIESVLARIEERAGQAAERGLDTGSVEAAIISAQETIDAAKTEVAAQAAKIYEFEPSAEESLRPDITALKNDLRADLEHTRGYVLAARESVRNAAILLGQVIK
jgi:hypothetical protein